MLTYISDGYDITDGPRHDEESNDVKVFNYNQLYNTTVYSKPALQFMLYSFFNHTHYFYFNDY